MLQCPKACEFCSDRWLSLFWLHAHYFHSGSVRRSRPSRAMVIKTMAKRRQLRFCASVAPPLGLASIVLCSQNAIFNSDKHVFRRHSELLEASILHLAQKRFSFLEQSSFLLQEVQHKWLHNCVRNYRSYFHTVLLMYLNINPTMFCSYFLCILRTKT